jgi:hypothetical protein
MRWKKTKEKRNAHIRVYMCERRKRCHLFGRLLNILTHFSPHLIDIYDKEVEVLVTQLQERIETLSGTF